MKRKENDLPGLHEDMFHVNLPGCKENSSPSIEGSHNFEDFADWIIPLFVPRCCTWMCRCWKWMDQWWSDQWVSSPTYKWGIPWGYNPTDPNLLVFHWLVFCVYFRISPPAWSENTSFQLTKQDDKNYNSNLDFFASSLKIPLFFLGTGSFSYISVGCVSRWNLGSIAQDQWLSYYF